METNKQISSKQMIIMAEYLQALTYLNNTRFMGFLDILLNSLR